MGDLAEARGVAENPALLPDEKEALLLAIETHQSTHQASTFIPLIPLDDDLELIGIQPSLPSPSLPSIDTLPVLPTTPLSTPNTLYDPPEIASSSDQLPLVPLVSLGLHQWPRTTFRGLPAPTSLTVEELRNCVLNGAQLSLRDQDALQDAIADQMTSEPMAYIGSGQQPPSVTKSSEQFPVGGDFLAGVGQQPPSILPDSSWSGPPALSSEPVTLKWTRARLNAELEAIATSTPPSTPATNCDDTFIANADESESNTDSAQIGGRTVASLTGYEWLSQFALSQPQPTPQRSPVQMILPLPTAAPMTSKFGWRTHPIYGGRRFHFGLDYGAPMGTPILASISGRVVTTGSLDGYGLTVIVENEELGLRTLYAHMSGIGVQEGREVEQGAVLGWVGSTGNSTGPHLHFEVHKQTQEGWVAMDPLQVASELMGRNKSE
ncbi:MAG: M23 family metallopeptidase [Merismopedia sp. SIO2A8]|nr:M23 family metallopeptidase [Merismopedia sp. SIO2A8]